MTCRYRYATTLNWGGDEPTAEIEVEVEYGIDWGSPESGFYGPPEDYDPGSPTVVEDIKVLTIEGRPGPWEPMDPTETAEATIIAKLEMNHEEAMIDAARQDEEAAADSFLEAEADEDRLESRR